MRLLPFALMVGLAACDGGGGSDDPTSDAGPEDGGRTDSGASEDDAGSAADLGAEEDLGSAGDLGAEPEDAGAECTFLDDPMIASCSGGYTYIRRWFATEGDCPDYWTIGGGRFETEELALASRDCTPECTRRAATSVSLIRCGVRTGYIVYDDPDCDEAVETPDGIFPTVEDWNEAHPCE